VSPNSRGKKVQALLVTTAAMKLGIFATYNPTLHSVFNVAIVGPSSHMAVGLILNPNFHALQTIQKRSHLPTSVIAMAGKDGLTTDFDGCLHFLQTCGQDSLIAFMLCGSIHTAAKVSNIITALPTFVDFPQQHSETELHQLFLVWQEANVAKEMMRLGQEQMMSATTQRNRQYPYHNTRSVHKASTVRQSPTPPGIDTDLFNIPKLEDEDFPVFACEHCHDMFMGEEDLQAHIEKKICCGALATPLTMLARGSVTPATVSLSASSC
jgi:hypothetical protein